MPEGPQDPTGGVSEPLTAEERAEVRRWAEVWRCAADDPRLANTVVRLLAQVDGLEAERDGLREIVRMMSAHTTPPPHTALGHDPKTGWWMVNVGTTDKMRRLPEHLASLLAHTLAGDDEGAEGTEGAVGD